MLLRRTGTMLITVVGNGMSQTESMKMDVALCMGEGSTLWRRSRARTSVWLECRLEDETVALHPGGSTQGRLIRFADIPQQITGGKGDGSHCRLLCWSGCIQRQRRNVRAAFRKKWRSNRATDARHWGTMTRDLVVMAEWLRAEGMSQVAMKSTGVYWKPIFSVLEEEFEVLLVNAKDLKHVPGHKTDVKDCRWISQL